MQISDEGLNAIEKTAEKMGNANTLLIVEVLRELRQLTTLVKQQNHTSNGGNFLPGQFTQV